MPEFYMPATISAALAMIREDAGELDHAHFTPALMEAARMAAEKDCDCSVLFSGDCFGPTGYTVQRDYLADRSLCTAATVYHDGTCDVWGHVRDPRRAEQRATAAYRAAKGE